MTHPLTEHQAKVAQAALAGESERREHLVVSLSGAHAYGFPSPDSDLDLKAIHIAPTRDLLGLTPRQGGAEWIRIVEGVEVDYSSNELQPVLAGILAGNGNFIERVLGPLPLQAGADLAALRPLVQKNLSRRVHRHYRGFATGQLREWEKTAHRSAKKLLYVLRTALTGAHVLKTGALVTDLTEVMADYGFGDARELVEQKKRGELADLPGELSERWKSRVAEAFALLDAACDQSSLPEDPPHSDELEAWLLDVRKSRL
jgi:predicted nucleotidyltransferase